MEMESFSLPIVDSQIPRSLNLLGVILKWVNGKKRFRFWKAAITVFSQPLANRSPCDQAEKYRQNLLTGE